MSKFYITTTTPYVNGEPHIGFAKEIIFADVIARWRKIMGDEVRFNTGTDEHGQKIYEKAGELGKAPQTYVDELAPRFEALKEPLNLSFTDFSRTSSEQHKKAAQEMWKRCMDNGYIYKAKQIIKYCVGCELEKTDSELEDGKCPIHPNRDLEIREEENYFFKFSALQEKLLNFYNSNPSFVIPNFRFNEIKKFVLAGLRDFSISRLKEKMSWGVPVPGDPAHVMYVWFDALVIYISPLGWPQKADFDGWWPGTQVCGKDNLRQQTAIWQAMLMAAGLQNSIQVAVLGFITSEGQKMSKSLGNVVNPLDVVKEYGTDALRYYLLREISSFEDGDFTMTRFREAYNANLANGLGNLASRIMKMAETNLISPVTIPEQTIPEEFINFMNNLELQKACDYIWNEIGRLDTLIQSSQPFKLIKTEPKKARDIISDLVIDLYTIARMLSAFLPATSGAIKEAIKLNKSFVVPIFPRK
ncbi:MAG TPA: methionine--tRNA ligase [Candidatus Paceibacterota bacterium]